MKNTFKHIDSNYKAKWQHTFTFILLTTGQKCLQNQAPRDQKHHLIVAAESDRKHLTGEEVLAEGQTKEGTRAEVTAAAAAEEMTPSKTTASDEAA